MATRNELAKIRKDYRDLLERMEEIEQWIEEYNEETAEHNERVARQRQDNKEKLVLLVELLKAIAPEDKQHLIDDLVTLAFPKENV